MLNCDRALLLPVRVADKVKKAAREEKWAIEAAEREEAHTREEEAKKSKKKRDKADGTVGAIGGAPRSETKGQRSRRIEEEKKAKKDTQRAEEGTAVDELQVLCTAQNMHQVLLRESCVCNIYDAPLTFSSSKSIPY